MEKPIVCVINFDDGGSKAPELIQNFAKESSTKDGKSNQYDWPLSTKYYDAQLLIKLVQAGEVSKEKLAGVEALILFVSENKVPWQDIESWFKLSKQQNIDCQILIVPSLDLLIGEDVSHKMIIETSILYNFEIIEMDGDSFDDLADVDVSERVRSALMACMWSNMSRKQYKYRIFSLPTEQPKIMVTNEGESIPSSKSDNTISENEEIVPPLSDRGSISEEVDFNHFGEDEMSFEDLFGQLQNMRSQLSNLPDKQRVAMAEKVLLKFWHTIGGPEDDISDI